jgi:hypothetical protein
LYKSQHITTVLGILPYITTPLEQLYIQALKPGSQKISQALQKKGLCSMDLQAIVHKEIRSIFNVDLINSLNFSKMTEVVAS